MIAEQKMFVLLIRKKKPFKDTAKFDICGKNLTTVASNLKDIVKVELLPALRNTTSVGDLLDHGFYCHCQNKSLKLSDYECKEKQYRIMFEPQSHFSLNNVEVLCDSRESKSHLAIKNMRLIWKKKIIFW